MPSKMTGYDPYAASRCVCGHLVYADETPGGSCRFCACSDHKPRDASPA